MRSTAQLRSNYNLIGLEDSECFEKLLAILDGKEKEIEKLKRGVATKSYDDLWDRDRNRTFVPPTPRTTALAQKPASTEMATQTDSADSEDDSFSSDGTVGTFTRDVEPLLPSTPPPPSPVISPTSSPLSPRSKRAAEKYLYPFRKAEQKLVLAMKTKIQALERKLADAETAASAAREEAISAQDRSAELGHLEELTHHIEALEMELADAKREAEEARQGETHAQTMNATLTQKLRSTESQLTMLEAAAETAAADIQALRADAASIPTLHTRIQLLEAKLADTEAEYEAVGKADRAHLLALTSTIRDLERRLADAEQDVITGKASYLKRLAAMKSKVAGLEARIKPHGESMVGPPATPVRPAGDQKLLDSLKNKVRELQARLAQAESVNDAAAATNANLQAAIREARNPPKSSLICNTAMQTEPQPLNKDTIIDLTEEQYDNLRTSLHALADEVQASIMGGKPVITGPSRPTTPSNHQTSPPPTSATTTFALNPSAKTGPILAAFQSLHAVLAHLADRCAACKESTLAARSDLRKAVGALKRARADVHLAEQARSLVIARVKELDVQCATKMAKLKFLDELLEARDNLAEPNGTVYNPSPHKTKTQTARHEEDKENRRTRHEEDEENRRGSHNGAARSPQKGLKQQQQEGIHWRMVT
ncbi:hypothetical protein HDU86_000367 [Geranomyces michiganensis]|nr:hypothetical protein HDU86_000367 [Geranomyces michiganensis]